MIILWDNWRTVMSSVASKPGECSAVYSSLSDDTPHPHSPWYNHNGWRKTPSYSRSYLHPHSWWSGDPTAAPWWAICWGFWLQPVMQPDSAWFQLPASIFPWIIGMDHIMQNWPRSDLDGLVRVLPNTSGPEASWCAGIIWPGFWQEATGPLPVSNFPT